MISSVRVAITGASGFVGARLASVLQSGGHEVRAVSTRGGVRTEDFDGCDAVVHLAGEPVSQRWTPAVRERIRSSRVEGTRALVEALRSRPPKVLVSGSAIGYYGSRGEEILTENSEPGGD